MNRYLAHLDKSREAHNKMLVCDNLGWERVDNTVFMLQDIPGICACMYVIGQLSVLPDDVTLHCGISWARLNIFTRQPCVYFTRAPCIGNPPCIARLSLFKLMRLQPKATLMKMHVYYLYAIQKKVWCWLCLDGQTSIKCKCVNAKWGMFELPLTFHCQWDVYWAWSVSTIFGQIK